MSREPEQHENKNRSPLPTIDGGPIDATTPMIGPKNYPGYFIIPNWKGSDSTVIYPVGNHRIIKETRNRFDGLGLIYTFISYGEFFGACYD